MAVRFSTIFCALATLLSFSKTEYIPPGPVFPCPKESDKLLMYPCVCEKGTDTGLFVRCENSGLAVLSVGLGNLAGLGFPIEQLTLKECKITRLFGPLLHRSTIRVLHIIDTPIKTIDQYAFAGVNRTLQELYMVNTKMTQFPKEAFSILGNLSILSIDGHQMSSLGKDIFAVSEAAGRLERVHLPNGLINDIAIEAFQTLKKLKKLDLHGNRLVTLKRNQFKGLRDTELLDLSYNNITKLDGTHIGDLTKLGWCNVSHNQIADIPRGMFARNTVLKVLHLDNNKIKKLDTNSFRGMRFLRRIYLQDNMISDVGRGTFSAVTRIGTVDLARNRIQKVDFQMFQAVKYAELINLAENQITIIETQAFTDLYLATVNVSHNVITTLEKNAFQNCNNLTLLDLSFNLLENITKGAFDENSYASDLQLSYNRFTDFGQAPIQYMSGIKVLNISHNNITKIPKMAFPKLYELHTVDVSYNNLSEIYNAVFQNLFSLRFLNLSHNSMVTIKPGTFGTIHTILELDLSYNMLTDVSRGGLAKLASCRMIDISHNYLEKIFQIPISLGELDISYNNVSEIPANTWPTMNALLRINLAHNNLQDSLAGHSFSGLLTLQRLDLSHNGLTKPPWEALNTMSSLQYLYLQYNNITSLSRSAFGNLPTLFLLDLSHNQLTDLAQRSFNGLLQLLDLSLSSNELRNVPNEAFKTLVALRKLDLSHNYIEKIDNKTHGLLDDCLSLEMVNLSYNNIGFLTKKMFPSSPWIPYRLSHIDLSHNSLPVVTSHLTHGTRLTRHINLSHNGINDIRNNVIGNLTSLEVLDLSFNKLNDLVSRTSDAKFHLPENITSLYLQNNELITLPIESIVNSTKLKTLNVENNQLSSYSKEIVDKIQNGGLELHFDGNKLKCDCSARPLKHFLNHLQPSALNTDTKYTNITCAEPAVLVDENLLAVDEERLLCDSNTEGHDDGEQPGNSAGKGASNADGSGVYDFTSEPDLVFRDVQYFQPSIYAHWFVRSTEDIADFLLYMLDANNTIYYSSQIAYNLRSLTITIDDELKTSLKSHRLKICVQGKKSNDFARKRFDSQCQDVPTDYESWLKKFNLDKRRLTKKKVRYSWFTNSVIGLVSDSILITLCIFLGACFRKLSDFDV